MSLDTKSTKYMGHRKGSVHLSYVSVLHCLLSLSWWCWWECGVGGGVLFVVVLTQPPNYSSKPPPTTSARSQVQNLREETLIGPVGVSAHPRPIRGQRGRRRSGGVSAALRSPCCDGEGSGGGAFPPDWGMGSQTPGLLLHLYC